MKVPITLTPARPMISATDASPRAIAEHLDRCMTGLQVLAKAVARDFESTGQHFAHHRELILTLTDHLQTTRELTAELAARIDRLERLALTVVLEPGEAIDG